MWIQRRSELLITAIAMAAIELASADVARAAPPSSRSQPGPTEAPEDPLSAYRDQFKRGMDRYKAGALAEAIGYWEPLYRDLGEEKGYRVAYDLGVAYDHLGDATHAAERLQAFLDQVQARRAHGEAPAPIVEKEERDARARIDALVASKGRINVKAGSTPQSVQLDTSDPRLAGFVAWVNPGEHTITFAPGTPQAETRTLLVAAGELIEVTPSATPPAPGPGAIVVPIPSPAVVTYRETHHPFAWPLMAVSGGVAVALGLAAVPLYDSAWSLHDQYTNRYLLPQSNAQSFANARTLAYADVGGAIGFAAVTAGLAAWYFLGTSERQVIVTPALDREHGAASLEVRGGF